MRHYWPQLRRVTHSALPYIPCLQQLAFPYLRHAARSRPTACPCPPADMWDVHAQPFIGPLVGLVKRDCPRLPACPRMNGMHAPVHPSICLCMPLLMPMHHLPPASRSMEWPLFRLPCPSAALLHLPACHACLLACHHAQVVRYNALNNVAHTCPSALGLGPHNAAARSGSMRHAHRAGCSRLLHACACTTVLGVLRLSTAP